MKSRILIWLPTGPDTAQHSRMRMILGQMAGELARGGFDLAFRSMVTDDFDADAGQINIWLASELAECPPMDGLNILWFLDQMKIIAHSTLLAHDGVMTASLDHLIYLQSWLGARLPIHHVPWPIGAIHPPPPKDRLPKLELEPRRKSDCAAWIYQLPGDAQGLADYFSGFQTVYSHLALRERMCGFFRYEEFVAAMAGCALMSEQRQGLPHAFAQCFAGDDTGDLAQLHRSFDPDVIAQSLIAAITAAQTRRIARAPWRKTPLGPLNEVTALHRDRIYVQSRLADLAIDAGQMADQPILTRPWNRFVQTGLRADLPVPFSDLTIIRAALDAQRAGRFDLDAQDRTRLAQIARVLDLYHPDLAEIPCDLTALAKVPWAGVDTACRAPARDFQALSRALNGHNLYRFAQRASVAKTLSPILAKDAPQSGQLGNAGVFLHAFYLAEAVVILDAIAPQLADKPIFVTTDTAQKADSLRHRLGELGWQVARVDVVQNIGRDVYPKLVHLAADHAGFDLVLHLHTKKSPHSGSLRDWGMDMVAKLAGDAVRLGQIAAAFQSDPCLGIIYADPPPILHPAMSWTRNLRLTEHLAMLLGLTALPPSTDLEFPAGSMFWARGPVLAKIAAADIQPSHFPPEAAQEDGTLAHAFERILGPLCRAEGFGLMRV